MFNNLQGKTALITCASSGIGEECVGAFLFHSSDQLSSYVPGQVTEVNSRQLMP